jgi:hypothetical protein
MYDVFIKYKRSEASKELVQLREVYSFLNDNTLHLLIEGKPTYLGLDLSVQQAFDLSSTLDKLGRYGTVVPSIYRDPILSIEDALPIAEDYIKQLIEIRREKYANEAASVALYSKRKSFYYLHLKEIAFEPVRFSIATECCWSFIAPSEALQAEGWVPGALFANIDKVTGQVWDRPETQAVITKYGERLDPESIEQFFLELHQVGLKDETIQTE